MGLTQAALDTSKYLQLTNPSLLLRYGEISNRVCADSSPTVINSNDQQ